MLSDVVTVMFGAHARVVQEGVVRVCVYNALINTCSVTLTLNYAWTERHSQSQHYLLHLCAARQTETEQTRLTLAQVACLSHKRNFFTWLIAPTEQCEFNRVIAGQQRPERASNSVSIAHYYKFLNDGLLYLSLCAAQNAATSRHCSLLLLTS